MASRTWELRNKYQHLICPCSHQIIFQWPPSPFCRGMEVSHVLLPWLLELESEVVHYFCQKKMGGVEQVRGMNSQPPNRWIGSMPVRERWPHFRLKKFHLKLPCFVHQIFPKTNLSSSCEKNLAGWMNWYKGSWAKLGPNSEWLGYQKSFFDIYIYIYIYIYTLEVQPPFFVGWFPKHHYFSRGLSSSKGTTIVLMVVDFQGIYIYGNLRNYP